MLIIPAIDLRRGCVVRLRQGDYERESVYEDDPLSLARAYEAAGARWLHVVDLDGARQGGDSALAVCRQLTQQTSLKVQLGGGVRCEDDVACRVQAGASRVVVGSVSAEQPEAVASWMARWPICVSLDLMPVSSEWEVRTRGWTRSSSYRLAELMDVLQPEHVLCTDISRDGMMQGPNIALYEQLVQRYPATHWQASGGVRNAADLAALSRTGTAAAIVGRALLDGAMPLRDIAC